MRLPVNSGCWNKNLLDAFKQGIVAQQKGQPISSCPRFEQQKTLLGNATSLITAWLDGWRWANKGLAEDKEHSNAAHPPQRTAGDGRRKRRF